MNPVAAAPRPLWRDLFHLAWPMLVSQLAIMGNALIDTVMAGRLSPEDLAAVGIGAAVYVSVFVTSMGVLQALSPIVAHLYGGGRHAEIGEEVRQGGWLALALSLVVMTLLVRPDPLLAFSHLQPAVELKVRAYLAALAWSTPAQLAYRVFYGFSAGIGKPRPVMVLNVLGLMLKPLLNVVFIYGHLGLPALGAPGCAVASSIISWLICLIAWIWCSRYAEYRIYGIFSRWSRPHVRAMVEQLKLGLPIGATFFVDVTAFTFMALLVARLGPVASGSHQIAANLAALLYMLPLSVGLSAGILTGHALGAGDPARAGEAGKLGLVFALVCAVVICLALRTFREDIAALYSSDPSVRGLAAQLIALVAFYHLADAVQAVVVNVLRAYKKAVAPMLIYAVFLWGVGLSGGVVLGLTDRLGPPRGAPGFWMAATAGLSVAGLVVTGYWWRLVRRHSAKLAAPTGH